MILEKAQLGCYTLKTETRQHVDYRIEQVTSSSHKRQSSLMIKSKLI